ncbi:hypothetical protein ACFU7D_29515 [Nocardioides sp. NPDC057577]|uniref:hypothetical protein n=1 Tax=unclassified Nocardioides TaxID=2615069 RepID=UPI00365A2249
MSFKDNAANWRDGVQKGVEGAKPAVEDAKVKSAPHLVTGGEKTIEKAGEFRAQIEAKRAAMASAPDAESPRNQALSGLLQVGAAATDVAAQAGEWLKETGSKWGTDTGPVVVEPKEIPGDVPPPPDFKKPDDQQ